MARQITVVVMDDHPFYRDGLSRGLTLDGRVVQLAVDEHSVSRIDRVRRCVGADAALLAFRTFFER